MKNFNPPTEESTEFSPHQVVPQLWPCARLDLSENIGKLTYDWNSFYKRGYKWQHSYTAKNVGQMRKF